MANLNVNPSARAQLGYNGFDLSKIHKFSSSVGQILPVYFDLANPGDKYSLGTQLKTRTMNLDTAAMASISENIDWFFVPMTQLCSWFDAFYYGIQDFKSSFIDSDTFVAKFPRFTYATLKSAMLVENQYGFDSEEPRAQAIRLLDSLGFPVQRLFGEGSTSSVTFSFNPILLCAYQKIYSDYYRLSDRESNSPVCYNLDDFYDNSDISAGRLARLLQLRYIPWQKDFFTNTFVSPIFGTNLPSALTSDGSANYNYTAVNQWLTSTYGFDLISIVGNKADSSNPNEQYGSVGTTASGIIGTPESANMSKVNTANIRTMFALDKLLEVTRRAGKHYDKQTLAHFGVEVPTGIAGEVMFINHSESRIDIGDVISTATGSATIGDRTATSALGQVGGKGYGFGENRTEFSAPCHGVLMAVYYARPEVDYIQNGVDRLNTLINPEDFYKPEFDDLGMQPLFRYQSFFEPSENQEVRNSTILGWQYRYSELKSKYNTITSGLAYSNLNSWTTHRVGVKDDGLLNFLVNPAFLNSIMAQDYVSTVETGNSSMAPVFQYDPLIHQIRFDVKKASKMSTYGLPSL